MKYKVKRPSTLTVSFPINSLDAHPAARVAYMPTRADVAAYLRNRLAPGDVCLTLGAGDLTLLADELLQGDPPSPAPVAP